MELWATWTHLLETAITSLSTHFGISQALAIIAFTCLVRLALMPVSLAAAYRMQRKKDAMARIKPALEELRAQHKDDPAELAAKTMALYRENGISFIDRLTLLNIGTQTVVGLGLFQTLKRMVFNSKFLWIANLAKPDLALTVIVGVLMLLGMAAAPGIHAEPATLLAMAIPLVISIVAVAALPSALGIYWASSNIMTLLQTLALRGLMSMRRDQVMPEAA